MRGLVVLALAAVLTVPLPAVAGELPEYQPDEFDLLFRTAPLSNLAEVGPAPSITGDASLDARIRALAEARGYLRRPLPEGSVGSADGVVMQASAAAGWEALQSDAAAHGYTLRVVSGYRNHSDQVAVFLGKLAGTSDADIERRLRTAAAPGYSKHHTGYALDISAPGAAFYGFGATAAWRWLSADNAEAAKRSGFIPSYPEGAASQGPIPEAWEWVYVGVDVVGCGRSTIGMPTGIFDDVVSCPDYPLARGSAAHLLTRILGRWPVPEQIVSDFTDDDGLAFEPEIALLASRIEGCSPGLFCPFAYLSRAELAALAADALGIGADAPPLAGLVGDAPATRGDLVDLALEAYSVGLLEPPGRFVDVVDSVFAADVAAVRTRDISRGCNPPFNDLFCPEEPVTRGQMAAFLVRALDLPSGDGSFVDTAGSVFADDAARLAAAGITRGCNPPENDLFCPEEPVTRGQMAAFLVRALDLPSGDGSFVDTAGSVFADDAARLAAAGITRGCNPPENDLFCPEEPVTRAQMAAFLHRALDR